MKEENNETLQEQEKKLDLIISAIKNRGKIFIDRYSAHEAFMISTREFKKDPTTFVQCYADAPKNLVSIKEE